MLRLGRVTRPAPKNPTRPVSRATVRTTPDFRTVFTVEKISKTDIQANRGLRVPRLGTGGLILPSKPMQKADTRPFESATVQEFIKSPASRRPNAGLRAPRLGLSDALPSAVLRQFVAAVAVLAIAASSPTTSGLLQPQMSALTQQVSQTTTGLSQAGERSLAIRPFARLLSGSSGDVKAESAVDETRAARLAEAKERAARAAASRQAAAQVAADARAKQRAARQAEAQVKAEVKAEAKAEAKATYDETTRGCGGGRVCSVGEENLMDIDSDPKFREESILVHEFGHTVLNLGMS